MQGSVNFLHKMLHICGRKSGFDTHYGPGLSGGAAEEFGGLVFGRKGANLGASS